MKATLSAPLPSEETNYSTGVLSRLVDSYREDPARFDVGGELYNIGKKHLPMLRGIAKVRSDIATLPVTLSTAPSVFRLETLSAATDDDTKRIEAQFAALTSETAREAYIGTMVKGITQSAATTKPATPSAKSAPTMTASEWKALTPKEQYSFVMKKGGKVLPDPVPAAREDAPPALTLDQQYEALTDPKAKQAFLKQHGPASLKRR